MNPVRHSQEVSREGYRTQLLTISFHILAWAQALPPTESQYPGSSHELVPLEFLI